MIFFFFFCSSAQRSVMSMMIIHLHPYDNFGEKIHKNGELAVMYI